MSLRFAILGFLSVRPFSGYDLKRTFDRSVRHFWSADQAAIYRTLGDLESRGLVEHERIAQDVRPDRNLFRPTEAGLAALDDWLTTPTSAAPRREPLLVKLFFSGRLEPNALLALVQTELDSVNNELREFGDYVAMMEAQTLMATDSDKAAMVGPLVTLTNGVSLGVAYRDWLSHIVARLHGRSLTAEVLIADLRAQLSDAESTT